MDAARQRMPRTDQTNPAWEVVKRWPAVRGEVKIAWRDLHDLSGGGREQVAIKAGWLGAQQNTSTQAGLRYLEALKREGLIETSELGGGVKLVTVMDPLDVAKARRACAGDNQALFGFLKELEESADTEYAPAVVRMASAPPDGAISPPAAIPRGGAPPPGAISSPPEEARWKRSAVPVPGAEAERRSGSEVGTGTEVDKDKDIVARAFKTKTIDNQTIVYSKSQARRSEAERRSGSEGGTGTATETGAARLAEVMPAAFAASGYAAVERLVAETVAAIQQVVCDPRANDVARRAAWAVEEGDLPRRELDRILCRLRAGVDQHARPIASRGAYFRRQIDIKFAELRISPGWKPRPK